MSSTDEAKTTENEEVYNNEAVEEDKQFGT